MGTLKLISSNLKAKALVKKKKKKLHKTHIKGKVEGQSGIDNICYRPVERSQNMLISKL